MEEFIDMKEFLPETIVCNEGKGQIVKLDCISEESSLCLSYITNGPNNSKREQHLAIPRFITKNERTFEVLGLLQAEMGKTMNGNLSFSNHEPLIINRVMDWFEKELDLNKSIWRWSVKLNIQEPKDITYKEEVENKVITYWRETTGIAIESSFPKTVTYVRKSKHTEAYDKGTLVLEYRRNLFSQIIKNFVKKIAYETIIASDKQFIRGFMRGIIAGEGCVQDSPKSGHYTVHITATKPEERMIYKQCLGMLGINLKIYQDYKEMYISEKRNMLEVARQELMTLSEEKNEKFTFMMQHYAAKRGVGKVRQEDIDLILKLRHYGFEIEEILKHTFLSEYTVKKIIKKNLR